MPFYFAWGNQDEVFSSAHYRNDEDVFSFQLEQIEGEWASLVLDVINPHQGLLAPSRKKWGFFSYEDEDGNVTQLFKGRVIGAADDMAKDFITISFLGKSSDYTTRKRTLAETLKVLPFYDPLWINQNSRGDPDTALEGRTALYHIDRVTHDVTISDFINGEAGTIDFGTNIFYDDTSISYRAITSRVDLTATVQWDQAAAGTVDLSGRVRQAFGGGVASYTGDGLRKDWPSKGDNIGAGWEVGPSFCQRTNGTRATGFKVAVGNKGLTFPLWTFSIGFSANYEVERSRSETVRFSAVSDVQPLITDPDESTIEEVSMSSADADQPIDPGGAYPIRDQRQNTFFKTDRGKQSLKYLLNVARAKLLASARAIEVTCSVPYEMAIDITCRHNARFEDPRIPGGSAIGKVIGYTMSMDGDTGALQATVTIGCCVGTGGALDPVGGTPSYAVDYVAEGYQNYVGSVSLVDQGDIGFTSFDAQPIDDDGIDLFNMTAQNSVVVCTVSGTASQQQGVLSRAFVDAQEAFTTVNDLCTKVGLALKPLKGGPFITEYNVQVTPLKVPKTIDLET